MRWCWLMPGWQASENLMRASLRRSHRLIGAYPIVAQRLRQGWEMGRKGVALMLWAQPCARVVMCEVVGWAWMIGRGNAGRSG